MHVVRNLAIVIALLLFAVTSCSQKKKADFSEKGMFERVVKSLQVAKRYEGEYKFAPAPQEFLDALDAAETAIEEYLFMYPRGEHAPFVSLKSAELYDVGMRQQFDVALDKYEEVIEEFPGSEEAETARERLQFLRGKFESSGGHF